MTEGGNDTKTMHRNVLYIDNKITRRRLNV